MPSPIDDKLITTLSANIAGVFDMIRKMATRQGVTENEAKDLAKRVERLEIAIYNIAESFKAGHADK